MNKLSEAKQKEKIAFAKELNDYLDKNYGDPHKEGDSFYMSEMKLANALKEKGIDISQKSINRYRSAESLANKEVQQAIRSIFEELSHQYDRDNERDPEYEDFIIEPMEYTLVDDYEEYDDGWDDEWMNNYDPLDHDSSLKVAKLDYYTKDAVQYIIDHVELFLLVDNTDIKFIKALNTLSEKEREGVVSHLASIPETLNYLRLDGYGQRNKTGICRNLRSGILYQGSHTFGKELKRKLHLIHNLLESKENLPDRIFQKVDVIMNQPISECPEGLKEDFKDAYREIYVQMREDSLGTEELGIQPVAPINVRKDFFHVVNDLFEFTEEDWFHLYLFVRLQIIELSEQVCGEQVRLVQVFENYMVQEKEAMVWRYLQMMEVL